MMLGWYETGMAGGKPVMPADGHTWRTTPALNQDIWESFQATDLATVREDLDASHKRLGALIRSHDDEELFEKRRYVWTGSTSS